MRQLTLFAAPVALAALALSCATPALANKSADAQAAFAIGRDNEAINLYGEAIADSNGDPSAQAIAFFGRGEVLAMNRRTDEAIADFTSALALPQDDASRATTLFSRAEAYSRRQMNDLAIADYSESLRLAPGVVGVHYARGTLYRRMDRKAEALADFDAELKINPTSYRALTTRADMLGLPMPKTGARGFEEEHFGAKK
jgi:tetratricopeptide (TPR) repeat protein